MTARRRASAKVSVVGLGMPTHTGVAAQMFQALAEAGVNIQMITTSEIKISVLVARDQCDAALRRSTRRSSSTSRPTSRRPSASGRSRRGNGDAASQGRLLHEVVSKLVGMEDIVVSEVLLDESQARVTISDMPDVPGISAPDLLGRGRRRRDGRHDRPEPEPRRPGPRVVHRRRDRPRAVPAAGPRSDLAVADGEADLRRRDRQAVGHGHRPADPHRRRRTDVPGLADAQINMQLINTSEMRMSAVIARGEGAEGSRRAAEGLQSRTGRIKGSLKHGLEARATNGLLAS